MTWMLVFLKKDECMERCAHPSPFISLDRSSSAVLSSARTPPNDNTWWQLLKMKDLFLVRPLPAQRCILSLSSSVKILLRPKDLIVWSGVCQLCCCRPERLPMTTLDDSCSRWKTSSWSGHLLHRDAFHHCFVQSKFLFCLFDLGFVRCVVVGTECIPMTTCEDSCSRWNTSSWSGHRLHNDEFRRPQKCVCKNY